ncbi:RNA polymerase sigma factor [Lapidilactobacillus mulanensis]|uniref:RNA polymerase sigma factor n=2 Tax=Lapidilactobacillus mulanensis TaxID=2485999 RepID=A0ABW4DNB1_9LACO
MALDETYLADLETPPATEPLDFDALFTPLSPTERQVFQLYFIDDLTPQEIAAKLKMKRLAVYKHLSRGRLKLKQEVKQHDLN